ncbi:XRE family transcriptional regulator [Rhodocyclus tenuis]|uniref:Uncharacterized protein n=1 Tax=Rhodocyclus tenuis TaxID=1066 RepID=A0A840FZG6_RHOTE|nr:XRE family transcriptional regulator [Rhodocyclus tenuis]MBB4247284.1 hypothetical protein [Rhodocyclus tenuis]
MAKSPTVDRALAERLLIAAVADAGRAGKAAVAARLGYGRALISRTLSPSDPLGMSDALAERVIATYHRIEHCPGTGDEQPRAECLRIAGLERAPMHNPAAMRVWKACQTCPNKPAPAGGKESQ